MVSLPLTPHRVRFRMIDYTFTSDEAITNLGSLKFSQSNRMPDPKDSSRVVTTTTTTTFSMAKEMARSVCQKFLEAKFIESVEGKTDFTNKSSVWQLTPKGIHILERFCTRNGIQSAHVKAVIESNRNPHVLVILERNTENDKLHHDEQTIEILFRRFIGTTANEIQSDSDSIHEFSKCDVGVKLVKHRPTTSRQYEYTFNGRNAAQWLMDCTTMVDPHESIEIGSLFLQLKLIAPVDPRVPEHTFQPVKQVHYYVTPHGERVAGWSLEEAPSSGEAIAAKTRDGMARDSNSNRTNVIIRNPSWRLLYREFLKETMCEENLSFYLEVQEFNRQYRAAISDKGENKVETIRETLAAAYGLYNAFLAPGSPNELNIDHGLRTQLATRMTRAVGDDAAMLQSLNEVATLFDKAQNSIFKLMSSVSQVTAIPSDPLITVNRTLCPNSSSTPSTLPSSAVSMLQLPRPTPLFLPALDERQRRLYRFPSTMICFTILDVFLGPMHYSPSFSVHFHRLLAFPDRQKHQHLAGDWFLLISSAPDLRQVSLTRHPNYPVPTLARPFSTTSAKSADFGFSEFDDLSRLATRKQSAFFFGYLTPFLSDYLEPTRGI